MRTIFLSTFAAIALISCSPVSKHALDKIFRQTERNFQDNTGFMLYDPGAKRAIYEFNASTYFTPASNTKIFTFFTALNMIGDSVPSLRYVVRGDSMIFWGTGDPSFLYKNVFQNGRTFAFLKNTEKKLYLSDDNFKTNHFGSGWAWDDYNEAYSSERSSFPIYGNAFSVTADWAGFHTRPSFMNKYGAIGSTATAASLVRNPDSNFFTYFPATDGKLEADIPFKVDRSLTAQLLADTLRREVQPISMGMVKNALVYYSVPADSLYKVMMQESDNFIAEQLLLMCAGISSDTLQPEIAIKMAKKELLSDLVDKPVWVDGSGLSRYNLFTPRTIVQLWEKIYHRVPRERLFSLLASGGGAGTMRNWYKGEKPFVFGKTGTLSNNHCVSGYLVTRKDKTLIFSFMNGNFTTSTNSVRRNMQSLLNLLYEKY